MSPIQKIVIMATMFITAKIAIYVLMLPEMKTVAISMMLIRTKVVMILPKASGPNWLTNALIVAVSIIVSLWITALVVMIRAFALIATIYTTALAVLV